MSLTLSRADVSGCRDEALSSVHNQGFEVVTRSTTDIAASSTTTTLIDQSSDPLLSCLQTRNPFSSFRINNCFCQIPLKSVFEVLFKLILDDFTFNKFVFRTRGSLLLSELLASSRIRHGRSPLSVSHRKCILLSETECHIINNLLTELARAVLGNIGPRSWQYGPSEARSALP